MATAVVAAPRDAKLYKPEIPPDWCPGCGDYGVLTVLQRACGELGILNEQLMVVSGIGCSSNLPGFFRSYGMHSLHGRSLPVATGAKMGNHEMTVIACGGDGDGYGIGQGHFIHSMRRNVNMTYIVMDNEIYGLTTGQTSPTSESGMKTKSTPNGNPEGQLNPIALALAAGCGFVARGFSGDINHLKSLYTQAIQYPGFALIDVFSPCVTFNKQNTFGWFKERVYKLEDKGHNPTDWASGMERSKEWGAQIPIGVFYKNPNPPPSLDAADPALQGAGLSKTKKLGLTAEQRKKLIEEYV
jgi:2-oxoglutarate/2-oxoacid ferredoxin oxidoreductase subunit beta